MPTNAKAGSAEKVRKRLTKAVKVHSLVRTKTSFWVRERVEGIEFVHLHLFSFAWSFRVHLGIRILNDPFVAVALNGLASQDGWFDNGRRYVFEFGEDEASIQNCADSLASFVRDEAMPYFERFSGVEALLEDAASPLNAQSRAALRLALQGKREVASEALSRKLLGLPNQRLHLTPR